MSVESIARVLNTDLGVEPRTKLVLVGIANHDGDGGAWPSIATLARYAMCSERTVKRQLRILEERGLIRVHKNEGGHSRTRNDRRPNLYEIVWDGVTSCDTPSDSRGDISGTHGVTSDAQRGDIAVSPEPSLEPSLEPSTPYSPPTVEVEVVPEWEVFFNHFWDAYPRKVGKPAARRAMKAKYTHEQGPIIAQGTNAWLDYWRDAGTAEQYIPHPSTFLNQDRHLDTPPRIDPAKKETAEAIIERIRNRDS